MGKVNGNNWLLILGAVLVVGVLSSVVTSSITGNAFRDMFNGNRAVASSNVRANSCNADEICEVNWIAGKDEELLRITSGRNGRLELSTGSSRGIQFLGDVNAMGFNINAASATFGRISLKDGDAGSHKAATMVIAGDYDKVNRVQKPVELVIKTSELERGLFSPFTVRVVGDLLVTSLGRSDANEPENAFACFDAAGKLYRSSTTCA